MIQLIKQTVLLIALCLGSRIIYAENTTTTTTLKINENITTNLDGLATNLTTALTELTTQKDAEKVKVKKAALNTGLVALNELSATATKLKAELTAVNQKLNAINTNQANETLTSLEAWEVEQLARVNKSTDGVGLRQARDITTELIYNYNWRLKACVSDIEGPQRDYEQLLKAKINQNQVYATKLINEMKLCENTKRSSDRCKNGINDKVYRVTNAPNDLRVIVRSGKALTDTSEYGIICTKHILANLEKAKASAKLDLDGIIRDNPSKTESDTTTANSATSDSATTKAP